MSSGSTLSSGFFLFLSVWLFCFVEVVCAESLNTSGSRDGHSPQKDLSPIYQECIGCHTPHRSVPERGYTERKVGKWNDNQCMGCHKEFNELGQLFIGNPKHEKFVMLPLTDEKLAHIAANPLGYTHAPENPGVWVEGIERITVDDLLVYLQHPMRMNAGYFNNQIGEGKPNASEPIRMPAYPTLNPEQLKAILSRLYPEQKNHYEHQLREKKVEMQSASDLTAPKAWTAHCQACHAENTFSSAPVSAMNLSLYSPDWLYAYARGDVKHHRLATRTMPVFSISRDDARAIKSYLLGMRQSTLAAVDNRIAAIQFSVPV
jgi:predicted CXXCH cytochrome family protein